MNRSPPLMSGRASCQLRQVAPTEVTDGICQSAHVTSTRAVSCAGILASSVPKTGGAFDTPKKDALMTQSWGPSSCLC